MSEVNYTVSIEIELTPQQYELLTEKFEIDKRIKDGAMGALGEMIREATNTSPF